MSPFVLALFEPLFDEKMLGMYSKHKQRTNQVTTYKAQVN
jgi:hypothetical protein